MLIVPHAMHALGQIESILQGHIYSFNTCFLILQKSHVLEVKTDSHITSEHSCHTFEHLKTVEIKKCRRSYDIRVKEILKLLGDWGIPSSKISIHYKKSKGQS
jgi:hypothetical protein